MSKGSGVRPLSVPFDEYAEKRKAIFGERVRVQWVPPPLPYDSVSDQCTPEEQAKEELGPFVPLSSPMKGEAEGDDLLSIRRGGVIRIKPTKD